MELRKFVAPEIVCGQGALSLVGQYAGSFGARRAVFQYRLGRSLDVEMSLHFGTSGVQDQGVLIARDIFERLKTESALRKSMAILNAVLNHTPSSVFLKDRIFDSFFTTKQQGEGTALGLPVVHGIVKSHSGAVDVSSTPGVGTRFEVWLPCSDSHGLGLKAIKGGSEHILFVDDEQAIVQLAKMYLERVGYRVSVAGNGVEALEVFYQDQDDLDLIISDVTMPGATGVDLVREVLRWRPDLPVFLCTGYSDLVDEEAIRALGVRGLLSKPIKPINPSEILRAIRRVLDERRGESMHAVDT